MPSTNIKQYIVIRVETNLDNRSDGEAGEDSPPIGPHAPLETKIGDVVAERC